MATNKLLEAAAEILASGKGKNAMPPEKLPAEIHDAGGPTPQNAKPDDDSHKITPSTKSATAPTTRSTKKEEVEEEEYEQLDELSKSTLQNYRNAAKDDRSTLKVYGLTSDGDDEKGDKKATKKRIKRRTMGINRATSKMSYMKNEEYDEQEEYELDLSEDINSLFSDDDTISEEFKQKVTTIFEARVYDRVKQIEEHIEEQYASMLEEAVETVKEDLTEKVNDYISYVVEQWMSDNEIAIEKGIRSELTEDFISGLRNLFAEHYIDVPTDKVDLVDELSSKVDELEDKLNEEVERSVEYRKALTEAYKNEVTRDVCEGLTDTQVEKIKTLAESVDFSTEEEYQEKLVTIRENYFPSGVKKADEGQLHEQVIDNGQEEPKQSNDPFINSIVQSISKTNRF